MLKERFEVVQCEDPDYIIYSGFGYEHLHYDCIRIFFTGECQTPDFNECDYAIGVDKYEDYGSRAVVGGTETFIFLLESLSLLCYIGISKADLENSKNVKHLYSMLPCFTFFGPLIYSNGSMIRISMYSYMYLTLLVPLALKGIFKKHYNEAMWVFILSLSLLMGNNLTCYFFWQVDPVYTW